jgi:hypothetical protein
MQKVPNDPATGSGANDQPAGSTLPTQGSAVSHVQSSSTTLPAVSRSGGVPAPVPLPRSITLRVPVKLRTAVQILFGRGPLVAGQSRDEYLALVELALDEWRPQTLHEISLIRQQIQAELDILTLQLVQSWLFSSAIGAQLFAILKPGDDSTGSPSPDSTHAQATRNVIFAALAGEEEALKYVESHTGRKIGMDPETPAYFAPTIPVHLFADRAITTRLARRDAAVRELSRIKAERAQRTAGFVDLADMRSHLPLAEYMRFLTDADLNRQADPEFYCQELQEALKRRKAAIAKAEAGDLAVEAAAAPLTPGQEMVRELERRRDAKRSEVAAAKDDETLSVHAPRSIVPGKTPE